MFLTVHEDRDFVNALFSAGASAYVTKSQVATDLIPAIHEALHGGRYVSSSVRVGPGLIAIAITLGAYLRHQSDQGWEHVFPRHFLAALIGMLLLCVLVMICYSNADRLVRMLGMSGTSILTRLSALILLTIGVQIMWNDLC